MESPAIEKNIAETIRLVRQLFHLLKAVGTELHADVGVTVPMRGVLETIQREGPCTVPRMARMRPVSRQHMQRIVDDLLALKLVRLENNPDHKRSPFVAMTEEGGRTFDAIAERERAPIAQLTTGMTEDEVAVTRKVLEQLKTRLLGMLAEQTPTPGDDHEETV